MKTKSSLIDIIIPTYNYAKYIIECIESVKKQTFKDYTVTIIDNASTDNTREIVSSVIKDDSKFNYIRNESNIGSASSIYKAIGLTHNKYFIILCADDILLPEYLEKVVLEGLEKNSACAIGYSLTKRKVHDIIYEDMRFHYPNLPTGVHEINHYLCFTNWILLSFGVIRRDVWNALNMNKSHFEKFYSSSPRGGNLGDHYMWAKLTANSPAYVVDERLGIYRVHDESHTISTGKNLLMEETILLYDLIYYDNDIFDDATRYIAKINQIGRLLTSNGICKTAIDVCFSAKLANILRGKKHVILKIVYDSLNTLTYDSSEVVNNPYLDELVNIKSLGEILGVASSNHE